MSNTHDITEDEIITAYRMVGMGATWEQVVEKLYPDTDCPELLASLTCERVHHWFKKQTPEHLMALMVLR